MKVNIKDYQVIREAELEFIPGINVIVGSTNNGKSSIIRAIQGAINNQGGSGFINYDAESTEVTISDEQNIITWSKSKKQGDSFYNINGDVLKKIGQKQLPEVADLLNMHEVEVGNERFQINFWRQMEKPFLVDKTAYQLFDFISQSKEQEFVAGLQSSTVGEVKGISSEVTVLNATADTLTKQIITLNEEIKGLEVVESIDIDNLEKAITIANNLARDLNDHTNSTATYYEVKEKLLKSMKVNEEADIIFKEVSKELNDVNEFKQAMNNLSTKEAELKEAKTKLSKIETTINQTEKVLKEVDKLIKEVNKYSDLREQLNNKFVSYKRVKIDFEADSIKIKELSESIKVAEKELGEFDVCPLCGNNLDGHKH